jgi:hypothetical protein
MFSSLTEGSRGDYGNIDLNKHLDIFIALAPIANLGNCQNSFFNAVASQW